MALLCTLTGLHLLLKNVSEHTLEAAQHNSPHWSLSIGVGGVWSLETLSENLVLPFLVTVSWPCLSRWMVDFPYLNLRCQLGYIFSINVHWEVKGWIYIFNKDLWIPGQTGKQSETMYQKIKLKKSTSIPQVPFLEISICFASQIVQILRHWCSKIFYGPDWKMIFKMVVNCYFHFLILFP